MHLPEHSLEFLLGYDGREHVLADGYFLRFEVKQVQKSERVPHGLSYSFTLHGPDSKRLLGFDNAHAVRARGNRFLARPVAADHWHRTHDDKGRPYRFESAEKLVADFFGEVERRLDKLDVPFEVKEHH